jgi:hypothetical protein
MRLSIPTIVVFVTCCAAAACDDSTVPTGPSGFKNELNFVPAGLPRLAWSIPHPCSSAVPPFTLNVTAGMVPITLAEIRFQSLDPFRSTAPPTIFDAASLTRQFGSITIESFAVRQFPFTYPFGCVIGGTALQASVTTTDNGGVSRVQTMQVPVY